MKVDGHFYELIPKSSIGSVASQSSRAGCLLRFKWDDFGNGNNTGYGYGDCHPWHELGDLPLQEQLKKLQAGVLTELTQRTMEFARIDAEARFSNKSLFENSQAVENIPASHALVTDLRNLSKSVLESLQTLGFSRIKIKLGKSPLEEAEKLSRLSSSFRSLNMKFRLDFNLSISSSEFEEFLESLGDARESLDFVEDPTPYDPKTWKMIQKFWGVKLALDRVPLSQWNLSDSRESLDSLESFSVLVLKPAVQNANFIYNLAQSRGTSIMVTSYLDHPLGQVSAAWVASQLVQRSQVEAERRVPIEMGGLLSHSAYLENSFSKLLQTNGPHLIPRAGTGFGFDQLLEEIDWQPLHGLKL